MVFISMSSIANAQENAIFDIARHGTLEQLKEAMKSDANVINILSKDGYSSLTLACYYSNNEVAKYLIEHVKDVNSKSGYGTPLMAATVKKNTELIELLLKKNADPNATDQNGSTALHFSVIFSYEDIVKLLMKYKADSTMKDNRGKTAQDYANITGNQKIIKLLKTK